MINLAVGVDQTSPLAEASAISRSDAAAAGAALAAVLAAAGGATGAGAWAVGVAPFFAACPIAIPENDSATKTVVARAENFVRFFIRSSG